ncbi:hypothetical protein HHL11_07060 [Ramlibacter sp. G-1-2-2]|uniref:Uncharacterized protein n=1 Tax=Ramlibacter agri TaxID=2728837 RepID=A0A848H1P9_9BURK|nr:hypothetical protein [Ramlibacter agri]NML43501.1 hypothetical protein [Ramlibacter agri]
MNGTGVFITGICAAAIVGGALVAPSIIQAKEIEALRSQCWSENTQDIFKRLATGILKDQLALMAKGDGGLSRADIDAATSIAAQSFHTLSVDEKAQAVRCGAQLDFTFKRKDGKLLRNPGSIVEFAVHPSTSGHVVVTSSRGDIFQHIIEAAQVQD